LTDDITEPLIFSLEDEKRTNSEKDIEGVSFSRGLSPFKG